MKRNFKHWVAIVLLVAIVAIVAIAAKKSRAKRPPSPNGESAARMTTSMRHHYYSPAGRKFIRTVRGLFGLSPTPRGPYLKIGPAELEWMDVESRRPTTNGFITFVPPAGPTNALWEFALTSKSRLVDISPDDLQNALFLGKDENRPMLPTSPWDPTALRVSEGDIVFARLTTAPETVYALRFFKQTYAGTYGEILVYYSQVTNALPATETSR